MEHPVQVGECIGCGICVGECPVEVMALATQPEPTPLAPRQGPLVREPVGEGWVPLSAATLASLRDRKVEPFEPFAPWRIHRRAGRVAGLGLDGR